MIATHTNETSTCLPASKRILTKRETEVAIYLVRGFTSQQIAEELGLKFYTVTTHVKNLYKKMGVRKRTYFVVKVLTEGWLGKQANNLNVCASAKRGSTSRAGRMGRQLNPAVN